MVAGVSSKPSNEDEDGKGKAQVTINKEIHPDSGNKSLWNGALGAMVGGPHGPGKGQTQVLLSRTPAQTEGLLWASGPHHRPAFRCESTLSGKTVHLLEYSEAR